jgi:hypothetical protein
MDEMHAHWPWESNFISPKDMILWFVLVFQQTGWKVEEKKKREIGSASIFITSVNL